MFKRRRTRPTAPGSLLPPKADEATDDRDRKENERRLNFLDLGARCSVVFVLVVILLVNNDIRFFHGDGGGGGGGGGGDGDGDDVVRNVAPVFRNGAGAGADPPYRSASGGGGIWHSIGMALKGDESDGDNDGDNDGDGDDHSVDTVPTVPTDDDYFYDTDLLASTVRSRIIDEFGLLFDKGTDNDTDIIQSDKLYDRLWSVYDREGSYYDLLGDTDTPQGKAFRWIIEELSGILAYGEGDDDGDDDAAIGGEGGMAETTAATATTTTVREDLYNKAAALIGAATGNEHDDGGPTLVQRYVLAVLYFSTLGTTDSHTTTTTTKTKTTTTEGQNAPWIRHAADTSWTRFGSLSFLTPTAHECTWRQTHRGTHYGTKCCQKPTALASALTTLTGKIMGPVPRSGDECRDDKVWEVTELFLPEMGLRGTLPEEIGFLTGLRVLDLQDNELEGTLPQSLGLLTNLRYLGLGSNRFTGTVADTLGSLAKLETLYLNYNRMDGGDYLSMSVCPLKRLPTHRLYSFWADCGREGDDPPLCECCDVCCDGGRTCSPVESEGRRNDPRNDGDGDDGGCEDGDGSCEDDDDGTYEDDGRNGDGSGIRPPIQSRNNRAMQRKETREHRSQGWFEGWSR